MRKTENILNLLTAVIHQNKRNAPGNSEKVVYPWARFTPTAAQLQLL